MDSMGGSSFRLYLHGFREYSLAVQYPEGYRRKKPPPRRVGLGSMHDRLLAAEVFVHEVRCTSMGKPHYGLPPLRQARYAQTGAAADAIIHGMKCSLTRISPYGHRPTLNGRRAVPCSNICTQTRPSQAPGQLSPTWGEPCAVSFFCFWSVRMRKSGISQK